MSGLKSFELSVFHCDFPVFSVSEAVTTELMQAVEPLLLSLFHILLIESHSEDYMWIPFPVCFQ